MVKLTSILVHNFSLEVWLGVESPSSVDDLVSRGPRRELVHRELGNVSVQRESVIG